VKPLPLVLGAVALVSVLMLGGWTLTSDSRDVPPRQAPAGGVAADGASSAAERAGKQSQQAGERTRSPEQQDAVRGDTRVRNLAGRAQ
jgi:hypothetical protein